jgi:hypothetical protein
MIIFIVLPVSMELLIAESCFVDVIGAAVGPEFYEVIQKQDSHAVTVLFERSDQENF